MINILFFLILLVACAAKADDTTVQKISDIQIQRTKIITDTINIEDLKSQIQAYNDQEAMISNQYKQQMDNFEKNKKELQDMLDAVKNAAVNQVITVKDIEP